MLIQNCVKQSFCRYGESKVDMIWSSGFNKSSHSGGGIVMAELKVNIYRVA